MVYSIRPLEERDASRMLEWMKSPVVTKHLRINGNDKSIDDAINFIKNSADDKENLNYAIVDETDLYMGTISLKSIDYLKKNAEYAIALHCSAIGTGAAYDATYLIFKKAFEEIGLSRIYLNVLYENTRAVKFYERFGFTYTHTTSITVLNDEKKLLWYEKTCK